MNLKIHKTYDISWFDIQYGLADGVIPFELAPEDSFSLTLKNGWQMVLEVAAVNHYQNGEIVLVAQDCLPEQMAMYRIRPTDDCMYFSDLRKYLNGPFLDLLPEDFRSVLSPKVMRQKHKDGSISQYEDYVWLPLATEVFGVPNEKSKRGNDLGGKQFPLFVDRRNRVKSTGYWLSTTDGIWNSIVQPTGREGRRSPTAPYGVAPGFLIHSER